MIIALLFPSLHFSLFQFLQLLPPFLFFFASLDSSIFSSPLFGGIPLFPPSCSAVHSMSRGVCCCWLLPQLGAVEMAPLVGPAVLRGRSQEEQGGRSQMGDKKERFTHREYGAASEL